MESESKADPAEELGAQAAPDNTTVYESPEPSGFELTVSRLEQLIKSMGVLLTDVEVLRSHCSHQATELIAAAVELRQQQEELKDSYLELSREMETVMESVDDLFATKSSMEAKEKQTEKLSRQF